MFNIKIVGFVTLLLISHTSSASESAWNKSYLLSIKGNFAQAASVIETKALSNNEFALIRYAYLKYLQGKYNDSVTYYKKAIKINSKSIDAKLGITLPLMAQKRWRQVKSYSLQVIKMSKWNYIAHVRLMIAEEGLRTWSVLAEHANQLTEIYPSDATIWVYLARAYAWQGDTTAAKTAYKKVIIRVPGHFEADAYLKKN